MHVNLAGEAALVVARDGPIADAVSAALTGNGAAVAMRNPTAREPRDIAAAIAATGRLDILIFIAPGLDGPAAGDPQASEAEARRSGEIAEAANEFVLATADALAATAGRIVLIGSVLGLLPARRHPLAGLADGALFQLARDLSMRLGLRGVRINGLALGAIAGAVNDTLVSGETGVLSHVAPRRVGILQEVADAVLFLVDPENSSMTGHIIPVDGGLTAGFARDF